MGVDGQRRARMSRGWVSVRQAGPPPRKPICVDESAVKAMMVSVPLLQHLGEPAQAQIASELAAVEAGEGKPVLKRGSTGDPAIYFVEEGRACESCPDSQGEPAVIYNAGDWFGDATFRDGSAQPATIEAFGGPVRCIKLPRAVFDLHAGSLPKAEPEPKELTEQPEPEPEPVRVGGSVAQGRNRLPTPEPEPERNIAHLEVNFMDLNLGKRIGSGATGVVYEGEMHGQPVAIKKFTNQDEMSEDEMKDFRIDR